jgi:hypothetical protein
MMRGRVTLKITVVPNGSVSAAQATSDGDISNAVKTCMVQAVRTAVFERPQNGESATITVPFTCVPPTSGR